MNKTPLVSVILPNYNHSRFLRQRIDSILNQTFQDFELIILDDKSPDNSVEVIDEYRDNEKISHIVINSQNSGNTFNQWDKGLSLVSGEYIWIAESDDYAEPTFLESCVGALDSNEQAALTFTDSYFVDENGNNTECWIELLVVKERRIARKAFVYNGAEFIRDYLLTHNYLYNASMILFRRDALSDISDYYRCFRGAGDWVFWAEMILKRELIHIPKRLNSFRQHTNKVSNNILANNDHFLDSASIKIYLATIVTNHLKQLNRGDCEELTALKRSYVAEAEKLICHYLTVEGIRTQAINPNPVIKKICGGLFRLLRRVDKKKFSLLGVIPLYKIKYRPSREYHYLFGFIPLLKIK